MLKKESLLGNILVYGGCLVLPVLSALFGGIYLSYKYVDENCFFTDYTSIRIEDACKVGKLKCGIYSGDFTLYNQKMKIMDNTLGKVRIKDGEVLAVEYQVLGLDASKDEDVPTTARITICGQYYDFKVHEQFENSSD